MFEAPPKLQSVKKWKSHRIICINDSVVVKWNYYKLIVVSLMSMIMLKIYFYFASVKFSTKENVGEWIDVIASIATTKHTDLTETPGVCVCVIRVMCWASASVHDDFTDFDDDTDQEGIWGRNQRGKTISWGLDSKDYRLELRARHGILPWRAPSSSL